MNNEIRTEYGILAHFSKGRASALEWFKTHKKKNEIECSWYVEYLIAQ